MNGLHRQSGISLVEILVALVISLFLLAGIVQVYTGNRATFAFTNALAEVQENGRFALDTISQDLRLAGEWACVEFDPDDTDNINNQLSALTVAGYDDELHDFVDEPAIEGSNNDSGPSGGSDSLTIRGGKPGQANVTADFVAAADDKLNIVGGLNVGINDIILVARCGANDLLVAAEADILEVTAVTNLGGSKNEIEIDGDKSQQFENDAVVVELQTVNYSIQDGASGEPALFRQEFGNAALELVEGVEDMQVLYGVDTDSDDFPNQYMDADTVADFNDVVAVRIQLLLRSIDDFVTEEPQNYTFNGANTTAGDRRIRQVFSTTVALRNRIGTE